MQKNLLMPTRSGTLVLAKSWLAAGDEPLMSKMEARITLTGLNKQPDVLCIKTFICLHAAVRQYKQCWLAAGDEPPMSEREARITLTGLNK